MKKFIGKILTDIVLVGSVNIESNPIETIINHTFLYFEFAGKHWLKLSSVKQMSELDIAKVEEIDFSFEIDEDDEYLSVSIRDSILIDTISEVALSRVDEYRCEGKVKAIELVLENGQSIFIDGTYYTGIKIGEAALKKVYFENHEG